MKSQIIRIDHNDMHVHLEVLPEGYVRLLSIGLKEKNKLLDCEKYNYRPVEVQVLGEDQNAHHGLKNCETSFGISAKYVDHKINNTNNGIELVLITKNKTLEVKTHYLLFSNNHTIETYNEVKNISNVSLRLEYVSSFIEYGLGNKGNINPYSKLYFHSPHNSWHVEAQWERDSFRHLGLFNGNNNTSFKRINLNNKGSWSTKEYLPMCVIEDSETSEFELIQIVETGSWHIEVADSGNTLYVSSSGPTHFDSDWTYPLQSGETFISPKTSVSFANSFEEVIQEVTKYRRLIVRPSLDHLEMPVIYNDYMHNLWDKQTEDLVLPLISSAKQAGADTFVLDAGWFAKGSDWWGILGVWEEEKENWPHGLNYVLDKIRESGMKVGIWTEIEAMGIDCPMFKKTPKDWFFTIDGKVVIEHHRAMLDFSNKDVYEYAFNAISRLVDTYHLDYIKNDYNTEAGIGTDKYSSSFGEGLYRHYEAFKKFLNALMDKYPNLTIENCASGGCRMDYGLLSICPIQSTSDQTDYRLYPYLSGNVLSAATPEQAAVWSYPNDLLHKDILRSKESVALNMINAMFGRIHLASDLSALTTEEMDLVKEGVKYIKSINSWKKFSLPIYPLGLSSWGDKFVSAGLSNDDKIIFSVTNLSNKDTEITVDLSKYNVKDIKLVYPTKVITSFTFKDGVLKVSLPKEASGRVFEGYKSIK